MSDLLVECQYCAELISKRSLTCPHCKEKKTKICNVCNQETPLDSKSCVKCGDPNPFDKVLAGKKTIRKEVTREGSPSKPIYFIVKCIVVFSIIGIVITIVDKILLTEKLSDNASGFLLIFLIISVFAILFMSPKIFEFIDKVLLGTSNSDD